MTRTSILRAQADTLEATAAVLRAEADALESETGDRVLYTVTEVCDRLKVGRHTVFRMCRSGELAGAFMLGNSWRIPSEALDTIAEGAA